MENPNECHGAERGMTCWTHYRSPYTLPVACVEGTWLFVSGGGTRPCFTSQRDFIRIYGPFFTMDEWRSVAGA